MNTRKLLTAACTTALFATGASAAVTVGDTAFWNNGNSPVSGNFDASSYDMLVVVVTGENGNPGSIAGDSSGVTYDGFELTEIVDRDPIPATDEINQDQTFNSIWTLNSPTTTTGEIVASVNSRGNVTVFGLNADNDIIVGNTVIGDRDTKSADLTTNAGSLVIASLGMGGDGTVAGTGNTADVNNVDPDAPLTEASAQENGSNWDGHVTAYAENVSAGTNTYSFSGGNTDGTHVIAAEFREVPEPSSLALLGLGGLLIARRRRG